MQRSASRLLSATASRLQAAPSSQIVPQALLSKPVARSAIAFQPAALQQNLWRRHYASGSGLSKDQIQERVVEVLKTFEKVNPEKVTATSSFTNDLGLDSLDAVEVVMAIEEEFAVEISDEDADKITTVGEAIDYISKTPEAH